MKFDRKFVKHMLLTVAAVLFAAIVLSERKEIMAVLMRFAGIMTPFIIAFVMAYVLNPAVTLLHRKLGKILALVCVYIPLLAIIAGIIALMIPALIESSTKLARELNQQNVNAVFGRFLGDTAIGQELVKNLDRLLNESLNFITIFLNNSVRILVGVSTFFFNMVLAVIISIYMLIDKERFSALAHSLVRGLMGKARAEETLDFAAKVNTVFSRFLTGLIIDALIVGSIAYVAFMIIGVRYAIIFAVIIVLTNSIPYVGPWLGAIPVVVVSFVMAPQQGLIVAGFMLILQQLDANILTPKIMGNIIGLRPLWIIFAIAIGGGFAGLPGMILSVPLAAILKIILSEALEKQSKKTAIANELAEESKGDLESADE